MVQIEGFSDFAARVSRVDVGSKEHGRTLPATGLHRGLDVVSERYRVGSKCVSAARVRWLVSDIGARTDLANTGVDVAAIREAEDARAIS